MSKQEHDTDSITITSEAAGVTPKHTPGPWIAHEGGGIKVRSVQRGMTIATTRKADSWDSGVEKTEAKANADLMAAAPEMEKCLKDARDAIASLDEGALGWAHTEEGEPMYPYRDELLHNIDEALAKAHGKE